LFDVLANSDRPVVVFVDELPILINRLLVGADYKITPERKTETEAFLSWLRANAIRPQGKVRLVLSGSIGLEPILRQAGLNATVNNFVPFVLKEWSPRGRHRMFALSCRRLAEAKQIALDLVRTDSGDSNFWEFLGNLLRRFQEHSEAEIRFSKIHRA
jgi:hypothetical protein